MATNMASTLLGQSLFSGVCFLTPFYRLYTENLYSLQPKLKLTRFFKPHHMIPTEFS